MSSAGDARWMEKSGAPGQPATLEDLRVLVGQLLEAQAVAHVGSWSWTIATDTLSWSPELYRIAGRDPETFIPSYESVPDLLHPDDRERVAKLRTTAVDRGDSFFYMARIVLPDGTTNWVESKGAPKIVDGVVTGYVGTALDVTDRVLADISLREIDARYRGIVATSREGIWATDATGITTFVNECMATMLGYPFDEMVGRPMFDFLDEEGRRIAEERIAQQRVNGSGDRVEFRFSRRDGTDLWTLVNSSPTFDNEGRYEGELAMFTDISQRKEAEDTLAHSATHDDLTGLPNRALLLDRMEVGLARSVRLRTKLAVLYCDLDHFKVVNDSLGHDAGNEVLAAVAERMVSAARPGDTVARLGGDEFVICCEDVADEAAVEAITERVTRSLAKPVLSGGRELFLTVSIGIRFSKEGADTARDLLRDADAAMHLAKAAGPAGCVVFDASVRARAEQRLEIESALHHALERAELRVHYQPTVSIADGAIVGVEALVRWQHPQHGLQAPGFFIGVAEETGLIIPIGLWVLEQACRELRSWNDRGAPRMTMAVNISPRQLRSPDLVDRIAGILERSRIDPSDLCLEITENALMHDTAAGDAILTSLKALGLRLAIDDFGTGYSSLSYLRRFPIDILKIDQSFVAQLGTDAEATAIVTSIVHLAKSLKLETVAEGVETREQLGQLELLGCRNAQGYYWSKPVSPDEIARRLTLPDTTSPPIPVSPSAGKIRVVIADDEEVHRAIIRRTLERSGRFVVVGEAVDGQQAVELAKLERPDLVVLDLSMQKMDGLEAHPRILAQAPGTRVALLSGYIGTAPIDTGASVHLRKGVKPAELLENLLLVMGELPL